MSRRGIALGVATGVFFAFLIPIAQIPLPAALALTLRANIPAVVVRTLVNNPLTFLPVYYGAWRVGSWLLGEETDAARAPSLPGALESTGVARSGSNGRSFWQRTMDGLRAVGKPLLVGAITFACVSGSLAYFLVNGLWQLRVRPLRKPGSPDHRLIDEAVFNACMGVHFWKERGMYGFDHGVWMMGGWLVMLALWLLPFALLFVAIKVFFEKFKTGTDRSALEILEQAYAGGKIGREEFLRKRDDLQAGSSADVP